MTWTTQEQKKKTEGKKKNLTSVSIFQRMAYTLLWFWSADLEQAPHWDGSDFLTVGFVQWGCFREATMFSTQENNVGGSWVRLLHKF